MSQFENIGDGRLHIRGPFTAPAAALGRPEQEGVDFSDVVNLMQKFSCVSNLACLFAVALTRRPTEAFGKSICSMFHG